MIRKIDITMGVFAIAVFFLGILVFRWNYAWLAILAASPVTVFSRKLLEVKDSDEKALKALEKREQKERQQRLLEAEKRMKELGS